jgi:hypothetical protein
MVEAVRDQWLIALTVFVVVALGAWLALGARSVASRGASAHGRRAHGAR